MYLYRLSAESIRINHKICLMNILTQAALEKRALKSFIDLLDIIVFKIVLFFISKTTKINKKLIVFTNFSGDYECNPKYICEEILRQKLPYEIMWVIWPPKTKNVYNNPHQFPAGVKLIPRYSGEFYEALCRAHAIVDNGTSFISADCPKKKKQLFINTWHGSLGIKRFPKEDHGKQSKYNQAGKRVGKLADLVISNSEFEESYYRETYFKKTPIKRFGHARNDILFKKGTPVEAEIRAKVNKALGIPSDAKICIYAPTFRENGDMTPCQLPYESLIDALKRRFGGEWVVLTRFHFRTKRLMTNLPVTPGVISASCYPDIYELLLCADVGITDYSSWICEYIHTGMPGFLYATDAKQYGDKERGFYDPLDKMPFPLSTDEKTLVDSILNFDADRYRKSCREFIVKKGCMDDGHASERIVEVIKAHMNQ